MAKFRFLSALAFVVLVFPGIGRSQAPPPDMNTYLDIEYAKPDGVPLLLDLYVPKGATKPLPVIVWIHGGGWAGGDKKDLFVFTNQLPTEFAFASINYRLTPHAVFPAQIYDCKAAVRWVRANAAKYNLDPNKIAAGGGSAGGHLAALLGTTNNDPQFEGNEGTMGVSSAVQAATDYCGPSDLISVVRDWTPEQEKNLNPCIVGLLGGEVSQKMDLARMASPVLHVSKQSCPFYIVHGDSDTIVPYSQSVQLNDALKKAGVPTDLYTGKGAGHSFGDATSFAATIDFLKKYLQ